MAKLVRLCGASKWCSSVKGLSDETSGDAGDGGHRVAAAQQWAFSQPELSALLQPSHWTVVVLLLWPNAIGWVRSVLQNVIRSVEKIVKK
jgi:hypothetical protein